MFKFFTDLFSGRFEIFNETSSSDSHIEGFDEEGNFHHISKCGNTGIDTMTGDTYTDMGGGFIQRNTGGSMYHSSFDDDPFENRERSHFRHDAFDNDPFDNDPFDNDPFDNDPFKDDSFGHSSFGHSSFGHHGFDDDE